MSYDLLPFSIVVFLLLITGLVMTVIEFVNLEKQESQRNTDREAKQAQKQST
jgi:hypothetical protein